MLMMFSVVGEQERRRRADVRIRKMSDPCKYVGEVVLLRLPNVRQPRYRWVVRKRADGATTRIASCNTDLHGHSHGWWVGRDG